MNQFSTALKQHLPPVYIEKFKLTHHPFSSQYNSSLIFENDVRQEILKKLTHLIDFTNLILFIQGAPGLGKTTLIRQRIRQAKDNWRICFINAKDHTNPETLIIKMFTDFGLTLSKNPDSPPSLSLQEQLDDMRQTGQTPILIIDDIEYLNHELASLLSTLIEHSGKSQGSVRLLVSGHDIPPILESIIPRNKDRNLLKYLPLPPLTEKETTYYIKHRLHASGYQYLEPFNKVQIKRIYLDAKGFPATINYLADHLFSQYTLDYENKKPLINLKETENKLLKQVAAGLSTLIILFIAHSIFDSNEPVNEISSIDPKTQKLAIPSITGEKSLKMAHIKESAHKANPVSEKNVPPEINLQKEKQSNNAEKPIKPEPELKSESKKIATTKDLNKTIHKKIIQTKKTDTPALETKDYAWIKKQNPKYYTLQLIGGSNRVAAQKFIKKHNMEKNAVIVKTLRKGKNWYSVIYKSFKTAKSAKKASKSLPKSLRRIKPWARPFAHIQKSMR